jgi:hypothetical protein
MYNEEQYEQFARSMEERFPKMLEGKYGGFAVGTGWWPIIEKLCSNVQHHIDWKNEQFEKYGRGEKVKQVVVEQIKEKFGGLRFYYQGGDDTTSGMITMAETWASASCEECGAPGKRTSGGWIKTLCDFHIAEREAVRAEEMRKSGFEE